MRFTSFASSTFIGASLLLAAGAVTASEMILEIEIPKLDVAEYHRPYVAAWIESDKGKHQANLSLWYDDDMDENEGTKWLKDLRRWWRRSGRSLSFPVDALSSATRAAGNHHLDFSSADAPLSDLPPGNYRLQVEASREVGGREVLTLPFTWPPQADQHVHRQGEHELGPVKLSTSP